jgi:hypothetical protein
MKEPSSKAADMTLTASGKSKAKDAGLKRGATLEP